MNFPHAFLKLIDSEGGWDTSHDDPGNWTGGRVGAGTLKGSHYGISAASFPNEDIEHMTIARAMELYRAHYWDELKCDALPEAIRMSVFDHAVNGGTGAAARALQAAVGAKVDGKVGPLTCAAAAAVPPHLILARMVGSRLNDMTTFALWATRGRGWARRLARLLTEA